MTEWRKARLGDICEISAGGDRPQLVSDKETDICHVPIYSNGVGNDGLYGFTDKEKVKGDSITITARGANVGTVFYRKTAYYPIIRLLSLQPNEELINSRYLYYLIKDKTFLSTGSAQPQITVPNISKYVIEYNPDVAVQRRIAEVLSRYDALIENYQRQIKLLEEAAQRLYKEWFVDLRFPGHQSTPIINNLPQSWQKKSVNDVLTFHRGYDLTKNSFKNGKYPVVGSTSILGYHCNYKIDGPGIVTGRSGSLGVYQLIWENFWPHNTSLYVSDFKGHDIFFIYCLLNTLDFTTLNSGGAIPSLNRNTLSNIEVLEPSMDLQDAFSRIVKPMFVKQRNLSTQIRNLSEARDRLLPKLMSAEIEV